MSLSPAVLARLLSRPGPESPPSPLAMLPSDRPFRHPEPDEARIVEPRHTPLGRREFTVVGPVGQAVAGLWIDATMLAAEDLDYLNGIVERARTRARMGACAPTMPGEGVAPRLGVVR